MPYLKSKRTWIPIFILSLFFFPSCSKDDSLSFDQEQAEIIHWDSIVVAHWNIGNFSNGTFYETTISIDSASQKRTAYIDFLNSVNADILGLCEYHPYFSLNNDDTHSSILSMYKYASIGTKRYYNCNAIFTKLLPFYYEGGIVYNEHKQYRYYHYVDLKINYKTVKFVETHLDWNEGSTGAQSRASQIHQLVNDFKDYPYVIICGDFNVSNISEYDLFKEAGCTLANDGNLKIYPTNKPAGVIDNIILKGFSISNIEIFSKPNLSDHCLLKCILKINSI